ncbi:uncharacterized protein LOC142616018 [Castanea sativa]|uniref:uncharacterized protein LOC142616018 n=1 Tax=Castanea sativa TaxID=21020 RepID=UPI003F64F1BC
MNLKKKRVCLEELCPFWSKFPESTVYVLWEFQAAQDIWHGSARALQKCGMGQNDFVALMEYLMDRLEKTEVELMLVQVWLIWNQRNRVMHGSKFLEPEWLNKHAAELLEEFQRSQESLQAETGHGVPHQLNYDAAMFADNTNSGLRAVIKNSRGEVMAAMTAKGPAVQSSEEAELLACRKVMEFATDIGLTTLIVEGDSVNAMRSITSTKDN